jgi:branched-chain amino acid aminotransferase
MDKFCSLDFAITETRRASIAAASSAALYGKGVFTTIRIRGKEPFLWEKHWRRLLRDAARLGMELSSFSAEQVKAALDEVLAVNGLENGRVRITFLARSGGLWSEGENPNPSLLITAAELKPLPPSFRLTVSPYRVNSLSPLAGIKSCNYLENLIALEEAKNRGFDEALRLNEKGEIVSAAMANVIWVSGGTLYTPPPDSGCLEGTLRELLIERFGLREQKAVLTDLHSAEKLYLISSGIAIAEVTEIDGFHFPQRKHSLHDVIAAIRSEIE